MFTINPADFSITPFEDDIQTKPVTLMKRPPIAAKGFYRLALVTLSVLLQMGFALGQETAPSSSIVRGNVTGQTEQGQYLGALANATVEFQKPDGSPGAVTTTNENGDYEITGLAPGDYFYKVSAPGYADDAVGRGITIPDLPDDFVMNFILPRGTIEEMTFGPLTGHVREETDGQRSGLAGAQVFAKKTSGGKLFSTEADENGAYAFELPIGEWRVSALAPGLEVQLAPGSTTVGGSAAAVVDFVFSSSMTKIDGVAKEVYALASVQVEGSTENAAKVPEINFIQVETREKIAGTVKPVDKSEMASLGLSESSFSGNFAWYTAEPATPLTEGEYEAEGKVEGFPDATSEKKQITSDIETYLDIALVPETTEDPDDPSGGGGPPLPPVTPGIRGQLSGQNDFGEYLGVLAGAKVEILSPDREVAKTVVADEAGEFEIPDLGAGNWIYRITATGYPVEDSGRGFQLAEGSGMQIHNFVICRNVQDTSENGLVRGTVTSEVNGIKSPTSGAMVTFRTESGNGTAFAVTESDGTFEIELAPATWMASALSGRFETMIHPSAVTVASGSESSIDFNFLESSLTDVSKTKDLFALVSVDRKGRQDGDASLPTVEFVSADGQSRVPASMKLLNDTELAAKGVSTGPGSMRLWDWYEGDPSTEVPVGSYYAEARLGDFEPDISEIREVASNTTTWYDLALSPPVPEIPDEPIDDVVDPPIPMFSSRVSGSVSGQATTGAHEGAIPHALIEVFSEQGQLATSANADQAGHYEISSLQPGNYFYRVSGAPYSADDKSRGFTIPEEGGSYVQNFILLRDVEGLTPPIPPLPIGPGEIFGHVWMENEEGMLPLANTLVMVRNESGGLGEVLTDGEGLYSLKLPAQSWMISASGPELGNQVHPEPVQVTEGSETKVDFVFEAEVMPMPDQSEIYIITAVERMAGEVGEDPMIALYRESGTEGMESEEIPTIVQSLGSDPNSSVFFQQMGLSFEEDEEEDMEGEWHYFVATTETGTVPPGQYFAAADMDGYVPDEVGPRSAHAGLPTVFDLYLDKIRPEVFVKTIDSEGMPLGNVDLKFVNQSTGQSLANADPAKTDATGSGSTVLERGLGEYSLMAMLEGYDPQPQKFTADKELVSVTVRMFKTGETKMVDFTATVVEKCEDDDGEKVGGASVRLTSATGTPAPPSLAQVLKTGSTGVFSVKEVPEGTYNVAIAAEGYQEYMGTLDVKYGMKPATILIDPRNMERDSWIRLILTEGWGKKADTLSFHKKGLAEDSSDCKLDYAAGLSSIRAQDWDNSIRVYRDSVSKHHEEHWWDRACEGYICVLMHREQSSTAATEMRRIVQTHYQDRPANQSGRDAMHMFGAAVGVMNGPWRSDANAETFAALDRDLIAMLKEPLRSSYVAGRDSIFDEYSKITQAANDKIEQIKTKAAADKAQMEATVGQRMQQILLELENNKTQQTALTNAFTIYQQKYQTDSTTYQGQLQQLAAQIQGMQNQLNMIANQPQHCAVCLAEGAEPGCQECLNIQRNIQAQNIAITRQAAGPSAQYQQIQGLLTNLNNEYKQKDAIYRQQINALIAAANQLTNEYNGLGKQMAAVPDPSKDVAAETAAADQKRKKFMTYKEYPIEVRKAELLKWVTRKPQLPDPPAIQPASQAPPPLPATPSSPPPLPVLR